MWRQKRKNYYFLYLRSVTEEQYYLPYTTIHFDNDEVDAEC